MTHEDESDGIVLCFKPVNKLQCPVCKDTTLVQNLMQDDYYTYVQLQCCCCRRTYVPVLRIIEVPPEQYKRQENIFEE